MWTLVSYDWAHMTVFGWLLVNPGMNFYDYISDKLAPLDVDLISMLRQERLKLQLWCCRNSSLLFALQDVVQKFLFLGEFKLSLHR